MPHDITIQYDVNTTVFHVSLADGVREGVVREINVEVKPATAPDGVTTYDIAFKLPVVGDSSAEALEADLFDDLDLALAEYKLRIEAAA